MKHTGRNIRGLLMCAALVLLLAAGAITPGQAETPKPKDPCPYCGYGTWRVFNHGPSQHLLECSYSGCEYNRDGGDKYIVEDHYGGQTCGPIAYCEVCGTPYSAEPVHDFGPWEPQGPGGHVRTCRREGCGYQEMGSHSGGEATCKKGAVCIDCGFEYTSPRSHIWSDWKPATREIHSRYCRWDGCDTRETAEHSGGSKTCEKGAVCTACGFEYTRPLGHAWSGWTPDTNGNTHSRHCQREGCNATETENHIGGTATCISGPKCEKCNAEYDKPLDHDLINHEVQEPTCTETGWDAYQTCSRCDYSTYQEKAALGHDLKATAKVAATCTGTGTEAYWTCQRSGCGKLFSDAEGKTEIKAPVTIAALGHDLIHHDAKTPTCTAVGWDAYQTCSRCDYSTYKGKPAAGHTLTAVPAKEPTETTDGNTAYWFCPKCGKYFADAEGKKEIRKDSWILKATGKKEDPKPAEHIHSGETDAAVPATCTKSGLTEGRHCADCGEVITAQKTIPALGHVWMFWNGNGNGTHTIWCARNCGTSRTAPCAKIILPQADPEAAEISFCPVCGECEGAEATRVRGIGMVNGRYANLRTFLLKAGDTEVLTIAFDQNGTLIQPEGEITFILTEDLLDASYALISADGTESAIAADPEQPGTLTLNFTPEGSDPVQVMILKKN